MAQKDLVLAFVKTFIDMKGYPPSYATIAKAMNLKSKSNVHRMIHQLKQDGLIELVPHRMRSMAVIDKSVDKVARL
jgi:repressor LexA